MSEALTEDMIHVLLDLVSQADKDLATTMAPSYGGLEPEDPKTTPEGWLGLVSQARRVLETSLSTGHDLVPGVAS